MLKTSECNISRFQNLEVKRILTDTFNSNCYTITDQNLNSTIVIDPGSADLPLQISGGIDYIVLTHEHMDHLAGVNFLLEKYHCHLLCTNLCSQVITDPRKNLSRYITGKDYVCGSADLLWEDIYDELHWNSNRIRCIRTPGHSPASVCLALCNCLFTGDTLIFDLPTVTKLPGGDRKALHRSINFIIENFSSATTIFPGHGDPFLLQDINKKIIMSEQIIGPDEM
jgi:hydroxyacylglutathione hydrolase